MNSDMLMSLIISKEKFESTTGHTATVFVCSKELAEEIAESMEDNDYEEVEDVRVLDSRELDADDEDSYREYLEEEDEEEEDEKGKKGQL